MKQPPHNISLACFTSLTALAVFLTTGTSSQADTMYVANWNGSTIEDYNTFTGSDLGTFASIRGPRGVALDGAGDLYSVMWSTQQIVEYTPTGTSSVFASGLVGPEDIAFDKSGNLYVGCLNNNTIVKITPGGASSVFANTGFSPYGLAFDKAGNLYVANYSGNSIEKYTPGGVGSVFATGLNGPLGLAFDNEGNLFAANYLGKSIEKFTPGGAGSIFGTGLADPAGLAFDSAGNLFVADEWGGPSYGRIVEFTPDGNSSVFINNYYAGPVYIAIEPVPEPSVVALLSFGFPALFVFRRVWRRQQNIVS